MASEPLTTGDGHKHANVATNRIQLQVATVDNTTSPRPPLLAYDPKTHKFNRAAMERLSMATHKPTLTNLQQRQNIQAVLMSTNLDDIMPTIGVEITKRLDEESATTKESSNRSSALTTAHGVTVVTSGAKKLGTKNISATGQLIQKWRKMKSASFLTSMLMNNFSTLRRRHNLSDEDMSMLSDLSKQEFFPVPLIVEEVLKFVEHLLPPSTFHGIKLEYHALVIHTLMQPFMDQQEDMVCTVLEASGRMMTLRPRKSTAKEKKVKRLLEKGGNMVTQRDRSRVRVVTDVKEDPMHRRRRRRPRLSQLVAQDRKVTAEKESQGGQSDQKERHLRELLRTTHVMNKPRTAEEIARDREGVATSDQTSSFNLIYRKAVLLDIIEKLQKEDQDGTLNDLVDCFATENLRDVAACVHPHSKTPFPSGHSFAGRRMKCKNCNEARVIATVDIISKIHERFRFVRQRNDRIRRGAQVTPKEDMEERERLKKGSDLDSIMVFVMPVTLRVLFLLWLTRKYDTGTQGSHDKQLLEVFTKGPDAYLSTAVWNTVTHSLESHPFTLVRSRPKQRSASTPSKLRKTSRPFRILLGLTSEAILNDLEAVLRFQEAHLETGAHEVCGHDDTVTIQHHTKTVSPAPPQQDKESTKHDDEASHVHSSHCGCHASTTPIAVASDRIFLFSSSDEESKQRSRTSSVVSMVDNDQSDHTQRLREHVGTLVSAIVDDASHGRGDVSASPPPIIHRSASVMRRQLLTVRPSKRKAHK